MHREADFEAAIEKALINQRGYIPGDPKEYDKELGLFPADVVEFVQRTQPAFWQRFSELNQDKAEAILLDSLTKELANKGMLTVLREGFKCFGKKVRCAYFAPNTSMNPEAATNYQANNLKVTRQVVSACGAIPDLLISLNGLPLATLELKNAMTGQTVEDGKQQYRQRDPNSLLYRFKARCLVHFAADTDMVFMSTQLAGPNTRFLPLNRGDDHGAGNPPVYDNVRTYYLWDEVLERASLLDILGRFLHLQVEEIAVATDKGIKRHRRESLIFPRYHQLDAVRRLTEHAKGNGSGHNYLVQHSAGSGKSNTIAWLAHRLSTLHDQRDNKIFHSVVVITDRRVLDQQLQNTIYQFDHKLGAVQKIDENTQQLVQALAEGVPIIVSTLQKFPFINRAMKTLAKKGVEVELNTEGKRFAVIVDEAHSSQSGETAMELKRILNRDGIEAAVAEQLLDLEDDTLSEQAKENLLREQLKRSKQPNISFFAFTATPKYKTSKVFDEPGPSGEPPFHLYTMRQAIQERFILDVLEHYTCYTRYFHLTQKAQDDRALPRRAAARALARFVTLHDYEIEQKVEVIVEHFRTYTRHRIGGRAKAMVVTSSREHAVRYKLAFDAYIKAKQYRDIKSLVAFSGEITLNKYPDKKFTEVSLNGGIKESELPTKFGSEEYQVLLVAEKYQTGFDQPLLHTMYVDKRLSGIQAVQTLSRLNRTTAGKEDTFVLDFVNEPEEIYKAFKPYYEATPIGEEVDPQRLNDLAHQLNEWQIYYTTEVDQWCEVWFRDRLNPTGGEHKRLNALMDTVVKRYEQLSEEDQEQFKGQLTSFRNLYLFLSQIIPYGDSELEKLYTFGRALLSKLPKRTSKLVEIEDDVQLKYWRLQKVSEGKISLGVGEADPLKGPTEVGTGRKDEEEYLSTLVTQLNERFGTEFTVADQLFFDQVLETALANEDLQQAAWANSEDNFGPVFHRLLERLFVERMEGNEEIFVRLMNDEQFRAMAGRYMMKEVYRELSGRQPNNR